MSERLTEWQWNRDDDATRDCLLLTGTDVPVEAIARWTDAEVQAAEDWAGAIHLAASDNRVPRKRMEVPTHLLPFTKQ